MELLDSSAALPGYRPEALVLVNRQGQLTQVNPAFTALTGLAPAAVVGQALTALLVPETEAPVAELLARAFGGQELTFTASLRGPDGGARPYGCTLYPLLDGAAPQHAGLGLRDAADAAQSEAAVRDREKRLSLIFNTIADVIFVLGVGPGGQYRFEFINRAFTTTTGLESARVIGQLVQDVIPEPSLSLVLTKYAEAVQQQAKVTWIETSDYPTGRRVGEVTVMPVLDAGGQCRQLVGVVHDLTAQQLNEKALSASNERFQYALKATTDALYDWDVAAHTLLWGEGFEELFGYQLPHNPTPFSQWADHVHPDDARRTVDDLLHTAHHTQRPRWQQEYRFRRADGNWAVVFDRGYILRDAAGRAVRMIGAMQDITERKEAEARQQQLARELFQQNADLQQFTYIVSHNLRAPLANASGFAGLLDRLPRASAEFDQTLSHLQTSLRRVDEILQDINTILSVRERPLLPEESVPVRAVLQQVVELLQGELAACDGQVLNHLPQELHWPGRRAYFHSIFLNLITNAIKYSAPERPLRVEVAAPPAAADALTLTVTDNGTGFDAARAGTDVFQLYKRFHVAVPGRGIGLFLVRAHVESMGGRVTVRSAVNQGTTFTLQFSHSAA